MAGAGRRSEPGGRDPDDPDSTTSRSSSAMEPPKVQVPDAHRADPRRRPSSWLERGTASAGSAEERATPIPVGHDHRSRIPPAGERGRGGDRGRRRRVGAARARSPSTDVTVPLVSATAKALEGAGARGRARGPHVGKPDCPNPNRVAGAGSGGGQQVESGSTVTLFTGRARTSTVRGTVVTHDGHVRAGEFHREERAHPGTRISRTSTARCSR